MAAAFFNAFAAPDKARAISAGTAPAQRIHPEVEEIMHEQGIDVAGAAPQKLTPTLAATAQWLITMGCGDECPVVAGARRDDWPIEDPKGKPPADVVRIRDDIRERVYALIAREGWLNESIAFRA